MSIPTPWVVMAIAWGEGRKHVYFDNENEAITFHATREEANEEADRRALTNHNSDIVVLQMTDHFKANVTVGRASIKLSSTEGK